MNKILVAAFVMVFSFSIFSKQEPPKFIYAMVVNDGQYELLINPLREWLESQRLADGYSQDEARFINPILDEAKLCNLQDSIYEPCRKEYLEFALSVLAKHGITNLTDFQVWAESEI